MILLRAYASFWDLVNHLFGTHIPSMPPQMYGLMMAIAFGVGIIIAHKELSRKTLLGIFDKGTREEIIGAGIIWADVTMYSIIGYLIGLKALGIYLQTEIFQSNPQRYILSMEGSMFGGIIGAIIFGGYIAYCQYKEKLAEPKKQTIQHNVEDRIGDILMIGMIGGIVGSKLLDAIDNPASMSDFLSNPIASLTSGLSVLGGLTFVSISLFYYAYRNRIKFLPFADSLCLPFFISYAIGRLGCQFAGDGCWGEVCSKFSQPSWMPDFFWGSTYPHNVNNEGVNIIGCTEPYYKQLTEPHLQTPIYETFIVSILFWILWRMRVRLTPFFGAMTGMFLVFNGIERFIIEFVRENTRYDYFGLHLSQAQYISIFMIIFGMGLTYWAVYVKKGEGVVK